MTHIPRVIGISGKAGAGKDYVGRFLRRYGFQNVALAWPLKLEALRQNVGTFEEVFYTKPPHVRAWLQDYGVEQRRRDPYFWIKQLDMLMRVLHDQGGIPNFVITDVRFPNELEFVRGFRGSKLIRVDHGTRRYPLDATDAASHISEVALDSYRGWDLQYINNEGQDDLHLGLALYAAGIVEHRPFPRER